MRIGHVRDAFHLARWMTSKVLQAIEKTLPRHARTFAWKLCVSGRFLDLSGRTPGHSPSQTSRSSGRHLTFGLSFREVWPEGPKLPGSVMTNIMHFSFVLVLLAFAKTSLKSCSSVL
jgi:hypothetical protein